MDSLLNTLYIPCVISDGGSDHAGLPQPDWLNMCLMLGYHCKNQHKDLDEVSYYL